MRDANDHLQSRLPRRKPRHRIDQSQAHHGADQACAAEPRIYRDIVQDPPLYSYDYDADIPPAARAFKEALQVVDALLFVTPEYNRSIPGGLKNAIDWANRPYGTNSFTHKPSAVIGTSPGAIGTAVEKRNRMTLCRCGESENKLSCCNQISWKVVRADTHHRFVSSRINERQECLEWQAGRRRQRLAGRHRRLRRQPSSAAVARLPKRPSDGAA